MQPHGKVNAISQYGTSADAQRRHLPTLDCIALHVSSALQSTWRSASTRSLDEGYSHVYLTTRSTLDAPIAHSISLHEAFAGSRHVPLVFGSDLPLRRQRRVLVLMEQHKKTAMGSTRFEKGVSSMCKRAVLEMCVPLQLSAGTSGSEVSVESSPPKNCMGTCTCLDSFSFIVFLLTSLGLLFIQVISEWCL